MVIAVTTIHWTRAPKSFLQRNNISRTEHQERHTSDYRPHCTWCTQKVFKYKYRNWAIAKLFVLIYHLNMGSHSLTKQRPSFDDYIQIIIQQTGTGSRIRTTKQKRTISQVDPWLTQAMGVPLITVIITWLVVVPTANKTIAIHCR